MVPLTGGITEYPRLSIWPVEDDAALAESRGCAEWEETSLERIRAGLDVLSKLRPRILAMKRPWSSLERNCSSRRATSTQSKKYMQEDEGIMCGDSRPPYSNVIPDRDLKPFVGDLVVRFPNDYGARQRHAQMHPIQG